MASARGDTSATTPSCGDAELSARRMYRRFLAGWAQDALRLRAQGLDTPSARVGRGLAAGPAVARGVRERGLFLADYRTQRPTWHQQTKAA